MANIFIISAPSGCGKTSLIKALIQSTNNLAVTISHTTRKPRPNEVDGKNYFFVTEEEFTAIKNNDDFIEHAKIFDNYYGSSQKMLQQLLDKNKDVIFEIDWQGTRQIKAKIPAIISIFIIPPSILALEQRLTNRAEDDIKTIKNRMQKAHNEIQHFAEYSYLLINNDFDTTLIELSAIIKSQRLTTKQQSKHYKNLIKQLTQLS